MGHVARAAIIFLASLMLAGCGNADGSPQPGVTAEQQEKVDESVQRFRKWTQTDKELLLKFLRATKSSSIADDFKDLPEDLQKGIAPFTLEQLKEHPALLKKLTDDFMAAAAGGALRFLGFNVTNKDNAWVLDQFTIVASENRWSPNAVHQSGGATGRQHAEADNQRLANSTPFTANNLNLAKDQDEDVYYTSGLTEVRATWSRIRYTFTRQNHTPLVRTETISLPQLGNLQFMEDVQIEVTHNAMAVVRVALPNQWKVARRDRDVPQTHSRFDTDGDLSTPIWSRQPLTVQVESVTGGTEE